MSQPGQIRSYYGPVVTAEPSAVLYTLPQYDNWHNFAGQAVVRAMALHPETNDIWLASQGGIRIVNARAEKHSYRRFASEHGLPGNAIHALCIDGEGRTWVAGNDGGIACFCGERWTLYPEDRRYGCLRTQVVRVLCPAEVGGVWVATADGIYRIAAPEQTAIPLSVKDPDGVLLDALALLDTAAGLLVGTDSGLYRVSPANELSRIAPDAISECLALASGPLETIWAATSDSLFRVAGDTATCVYVLAPEDVQAHIMALAATQTRVWILTSGGLHVWQDGGGFPVPAPADQPFRILSIAVQSPTRDDYLWVGGWRMPRDGFGGVYVDTRLTDAAALATAPPDAVRWDSDLLTPHADDVFSDMSARSLVGPDRRGTLWVGGERGLLRWRDNHWLAADDGDIFWLRDSVRCLCQDGFHGIWLLAYPQGVLLFDEDLLDPQTYPTPGLATAITVASDGQAYCTTGRGLWRLDQNGWTRVVNSLPAHPIGLAQTLQRDTGKLTWWLGTPTGLFSCDGVGWKPAYDPATPAMRGVPVQCLLAQGDALWVGTSMGLWRYHADEWQVHDTATLASPDRSGEDLDCTIHALAPASSGQLWVAVAGGVLRYDPAIRQVDGATAWTPSNSGLGSSAIRGLLEWQGMLWIATAAGISRVRLA